MTPLEFWEMERLAAEQNKATAEELEFIDRKIAELTQNPD